MAMPKIFTISLLSFCLLLLSSFGDSFKQPSHFIKLSRRKIESSQAKNIEDEVAELKAEIKGMRELFKELSARQDKASIEQSKAMAAQSKGMAEMKELAEIIAYQVNMSSLVRTSWFANHLMC